jgi:hypothetical protein
MKRVVSCLVLVVWLLLATELVRGSWHVVPASDETVFAENSRAIKGSHDRHENRRRCDLTGVMVDCRVASAIFSN